MKRKLASVLVGLLFGLLATAAIAAEDDATATAADSSAASGEPAAVTEDSSDTAGVESSTSDGTIAATPAETDSK